MTERTWDRIGFAAGLAGIVLAVLSLVLDGLAGGAPPNLQPGWDGSMQQIVRYTSQPVSGLILVADGAVATAFLLLTIFFVKLLLGLRQAEGATGWLSAAALAGWLIYAVFDLIRFMIHTARSMAPGHHFSDAEAAALFDIGNALTHYTWGAMGMVLIPAALVIIRTAALPIWLGWSGLLIGLANLVWAWLPPGSGTPAELAFLVWILVSSGLLVWRPLVPTKPHPDTQG